MRTSLLNSKCTANVGRKMAPFKALPLKVVPAGLAACGRDLPPSDTIRQSTLDIANENKGVGVLWGFTAPLEALQHTRISQHRVLAPAVSVPCCCGRQRLGSPQAFGCCELKQKQHLLGSPCGPAPLGVGYLGAAAPAGAVSISLAEWPFPLLCRVGL